MAPSFAQRLPFFYGWLIAAVAIVSSSLGAGLNNVSMGPVFKPMTEDLGWSRTLTAGAITAGAIGGGIATLVFGRLADRMGARLLLPAGAAAAGACALGIAFVTQPWQLYVAYVPARAFSQALLTGVVPLTAVTNWFYRKRPRVMGLVAMATPLGSAVLVLLYQALITAFGWRSAFVALALLLWGAAVLPGVLVLRRQPEDLGLLPDGAPQSPSVADGRPDRPEAPRSELEYSWTLRQAVRTPTLWLMIAGITLGGMSTGGLGFHLVAYLTDGGIDPGLAAGAVSVFAITGALATGLWGFLLERVSVRSLFVAIYAVAVGGVLLLLQARTPPLAYGAAFVLGATARTQDAMTSMLIARYYGRRSFGAISGITGPFQSGALGFGPILAAWAFDATGSYEVFFQSLVGAYALAACLLLLARRPTPPAASTAVS